MESPSHPPHIRIVRLIASCATVVWSVLWIGLVAAFAAGDEFSDSLLPALKFMIPLASIAVLAWWRPTAGGTLAVAAGIFAMFFFDHPFPRTWLASPAILLGAVLIRTTVLRAFRPLEVAAWIALGGGMFVAAALVS